MIYTLDDISKWDRRYRAHCLNTLHGPKTAALLATRSSQGVSNLAVMNSIVHVGANPPMIGMIFRPLTVERHSYTNIMETGRFSLNLIHEGILDKAHQCSAKYAAEVSEFNAVGLTESFELDSEIPTVLECPIQILLQKEEQHPLKNDCIFMVSSVLAIRVPGNKISDQGHVDHESLHTIGVLGLDHYFTIDKTIQKEYAQP